MNELLDSLKECLAKAKKLISDNEFRASDLDRKSKLLAILERELDEKGISLSERERETRKVQDIIQMKKDAEKMMQKAVSDAEAIDVKIKSFHAEKEASIRTIDNMRKSASQEAVNNEANRKALEIRAKRIDDEVEKRVSEVISKLRA